MTQIQLSIRDFIINTRNRFRLLSRQYKIEEQNTNFAQALAEVQRALEKLKNAWAWELADTQKKAREKYTDRFYTYEEAIPSLREEFPLAFANCVFTKHWYSKNIGITFLPASDKEAYEIASTWLRGCLAKK